MNQHIYLVSYSPELAAWSWEVELVPEIEPIKAGYKK